jgi:hypothetical protein
MNPRVIKVKAEQNFQLLLTFSNGEVRIFDVGPFLHIGRFSELIQPGIFQSANQVMGTVQWSNGLDLCPDMLYLDSIPAQL